MTSSLTFHRFWWTWCLAVPIVAFVLAWTAASLPYMVSGNAPLFTNSCSMVGCFFAITGMITGMRSTGSLTSKALSATTCITGSMFLLPKAVFHLSRTDLSSMNQHYGFGILSSMIIMFLVLGYCGYQSGPHQEQIPLRDTARPILTCTSIALLPILMTLFH